MAKDFVTVQISRDMDIDIREAADLFEGWISDQEIPSGDLGMTFGDLDDDDFERVVVAICQKVIENYTN